MTKALLLTLLLATSVLADERLTNADIIRLTHAELSAEVIITAIKNAEATFDTSTDALIELRKAGVADVVISAMLATTSNSTTSNGDAHLVRFEFVGVLYRVSTVWSVRGTLRGYDDRLTYEPTKHSWQEHALIIPWSSVSSVCFEEGPIRGDLFLTVTGREKRIRLSTDGDRIQSMRRAIAAFTQRAIPECE